MKLIPSLISHFATNAADFSDINFPLVLIYFKIFIKKEWNFVLFNDHSHFLLLFFPILPSSTFHCNQNVIKLYVENEYIFLGIDETPFD
jgi:hypothetical protein